MVLPSRRHDARRTGEEIVTLTMSILTLMYDHCFWTFMFLAALRGFKPLCLFSLYQEGDKVKKDKKDEDKK